jgi:hypothetical protein
MTMTLEDIRLEINRLEERRRDIWHRIAETGHAEEGRSLPVIEARLDELYEQKRQLLTGVGAMATSGPEVRRAYQRIAMSISRSRQAGYGPSAEA